MKQTTKSTLLLIVFCLLSITANAQKLKAEDVLAKHLDSIGTAEARSATKNFIVAGAGTLKLLSSRDQVISGRIVIASEAKMRFFGINMASASYPGETMVFDGRDSLVAIAKTGTRSQLGSFAQANKFIIEDGLFGSVLTTGWLGTDIANLKGKLSGGGTKKVDGREVYAIEYARKGSDYDITIYFDKTTFNHVRTEYKRVASAGIGLRPEDSSKYDETRVKITEEYSDFSAEAGLNLPHKFRILYAESGQRGTSEIEWSFILSEFAFNQKFDPATFATTK